jgi:Arc/MetJ family transcription regulator
MADEGAFDFDRVVDLNKSVDETLLQEAMQSLGVDSRTEAINRSLRIAVETRRTPEA